MIRNCSGELIIFFHGISEALIFFGLSDIFNLGHIVEIVNKKLELYVYLKNICLH